MIDILTVGTALIDVFLSLPESAACRYNEETKEICMQLGEKLLLTDAKFLLGGNACNVAVGMSRAGFATGIVAEIGSDEFSAKITNGLEKERVNTQYLKKLGQSSFSVGISMHNDRVLLTEHRIREHAFSYEGLTPQWIYLTAVGEEWKKAYATVLAFCKQNGIRLALNPGTVQLRDETIAFFQPYLASTEVLFLNKQEAQKLLGTTEEVAGLLHSLKQYGCHVVVITDGEQGAYAIDREGKKFYQPKVATTVVEKTGAGDSFATGFLAAYMKDVAVGESLSWGAVNAVSVIGKVGAQEGLLTREQMKEEAAKLPEEQQI